MKLYSEACARNRDPILEELRRVLTDGLVVELASGTGMHAAHFATHFPEVEWQPTDASDEALASIAEWRAEEEAPNLRPPLRFDLSGADRPVDEADAVFCANLIHVAPAEMTRDLFRHARKLLSAGSPVVLYGPFRYRDRPLEPSNARFDTFLRERYDGGGIREFEWVDAIAGEHGFEHEADIEMPANNRLHIWRRTD